MDKDSKVLFELRKNAREVIRLTAETFKNQSLLSLRLWAVYGPSDVRPTRNGFSIRPELFPDLVAGLSKASQTNQGGA
jgi:hypothetical protein